MQGCDQAVIWLIKKFTAFKAELKLFVRYMKESKTACLPNYTYFWKSEMLS